MTNAEKWAKEIVEIARQGGLVAVHNGKPVICWDTNCRDCDLYYVEGTQVMCDWKRREWFDAEYVEPSVDWSKVKVDTKVLVSYDGETWIKRYFAEISKYGSRKVRCFPDGTTSWTYDSQDLQNLVEWKYAKLADDET